MAFRDLAENFASAGDEDGVMSVVARNILCKQRNEQTNNNDRCERHHSTNVLLTTNYFV